ncbi:hypothetical protein VM98_34235, partial [Streptomyces rubellomurinus subsp. indigoferus]
ADQEGRGSWAVTVGPAATFRVVRSACSSGGTAAGVLAGEDGAADEGVEAVEGVDAVEAVDGPAELARGCGRGDGPAAAARAAGGGGRGARAGGGGQDVGGGAGGAGPVGDVQLGGDRGARGDLQG